MIVCRDNPVTVISLSRNTASPFSHNYRFLVRCTRSPRLRKVCTMALTRRAIKRAGPSKKVWCSRLGSTKSRRFQLLTHSNLEFTRNSLLRESANFWRQFLLWGNGKKWVFQGWKQDFKCEWVGSPRPSCTRKLLTWIKFLQESSLLWYRVHLCVSQNNA